MNIIEICNSDLDPLKLTIEIIATAFLTEHHTTSTVERGKMPPRIVPHHSTP
jgi:hypothetical protein